tara:strand:- start:3810 stop:3953 length:144 start_codon:yes stop_codon:yes gene_type:complete
MEFTRDAQRDSQRDAQRERLLQHKSMDHFKYITDILLIYSYFWFFYK